MNSKDTYDTIAANVGKVALSFTDGEAKTIAEAVVAGMNLATMVLFDLHRIAEAQSLSPPAQAAKQAIDQMAVLLIDRIRSTTWSGTEEIVELIRRVRDGK